MGDRQKTYLTRYTVSLFKEIIEKERTTDVPYLVWCVSEKLEELYGGPYLESRLARIGLETSSDIRNALDEFMSERRSFLKKMGLIDEVDGQMSFLDGENDAKAAV